MAEPARWYVVHTYSGYENKVMTNLEKTVENRKLHDLIQDVRVPMETVTEVKDNEVKEIKRKLFPGYVLVKMVMTDVSWYVVRNIRGVTGFVGPGSKPVPLTDAEVAAIMADEGQVSTVSAFNIGDMVDIVEGAFAGFSGKLSEISPEGDQVTVVVAMPGRDMPIKLDKKLIRKSAAE